MNSGKLKLLLVLLFFTIIALLAGFYKIRSDIEAERYYKQGMELYNEEKYSDAFYNFKQIKPVNSLYTLSLIKEFQCAKKLSDKKTAVLKLNTLIKFTKNDAIRPYLLYNEALLAMEINKDSKNLSYKKFKQIAELYPKSDYGIASSYRAGKIAEEKNVLHAKDFYLKYLKASPDGKYALNSLEAIQKANLFHSPEQSEIIAYAYLVNSDYKNALAHYKNTDFKKNWYNISKCYRGIGDFEQEKNTIIDGLRLDGSIAEELEVKSALTRLIAITKADKIQILQDLYSISKNKYILPTVMYLLAENSSSPRNIKLYEHIVNNHKDSIWASNSLWEIFWYNYSMKRYKVCESYAVMHMQNYSNEKDAPRVAYWYGRALLKEKRTKEAREIFYGVIKDYPLSYYAFLSAKQLKMSKANKMIVKKQIISYNINSVNKFIFKDKILLRLANLDDYETIEEFKINDDFIKSWIENKKENYPKSITLVKNIVNNTVKDEESEEDESEKTQISFSDFELKLMYPVLFEDLINKYAQKYKQSPYLFLSLVREESHFNKNAKSSAGALGLAQIMPPTANFIEKATVPADKLLDKEENIKMGLKYFEYLVEYFKGDESLAILSYNAGPGNINKWLNNANINTDDMDTYVENIPYMETKNYIKKILSTYWAYLNIYSPKNLYRFK